MSSLFEKTFPSKVQNSHSDVSDKCTSTEYRAKSLSRCSNSEARKLISYEVAQNWNVLPLAIFALGTQRLLTVASSTSHGSDLASALKFTTGYEVRLIEIDIETIKRAIFIAYKGDVSGLEKHLAKLQALPNMRPSNSGSVSIRDSSGEVSEFIEHLVDYAIAQCASDIHIAPLIDGTHVRLRVGGELLSHDKSVATIEQHHQIINRIKVLSRMDTTQRYIPQDGSFTVPCADHQVHLRVSTIPTVHGEKVVLRLLSSAETLDLGELGITDTLLSTLHAHLDKREGMIVFAGATGSGKTTSMYAGLKYLQCQNLSITTIEDPVELHISGISQTSINEKAGLNYSCGLRALLRQDPDVIMIGEIRDAETAKVALQAAMTGHLLLTTVHARSTSEILSRLAGLGVDNLSISQSINLMICQSLVPELCPACKVIDLIASKAANADCYKPVGCANCDYSGYGSRKLHMEILEMNPELSKALLENTVEHYFKEVLRKKTDQHQFVV